MVPLIEREVIEKNGWVAREEFLDLLTLAQSAPGPIALNTAVTVVSDGHCVAIIYDYTSCGTIFCRYKG